MARIRMGKTHMSLLLGAVNQVVAFNRGLVGVARLVLRHDMVRVVRVVLVVLVVRVRVLDLAWLSLFHGGW